MHGVQDMLTQEYTSATYGDRIVDNYDHPAQVPGNAEEIAAFLWELAGCTHRGGSPAGAPSALEFGVGTGRVALPLAERGCVVAGVDSSPAMLERCRDKDTKEQLHLVLGDMASTRLDEAAFDVVYIVYGTLYYAITQEAQIAIFENAAWHLKPGGHLVVEAWIPDIASFIREQRFRIYDLQVDLVDIDLFVHDPIRQLLLTQNLIFRPTGTEFIPSKRRYVWPSEMDLMARLGGLDPVGRYADWNRSPFTGPTGTHVSVYRR
jgi:SAM-dependent methyltransferase